MPGKKKEDIGAMAPEDLSIEDSFARLQELLARMEEEDVTLEESFACYEEGMKLVRRCNDKIAQVEQKVMVLSEDGSLDEF